MAIFNSYVSHYQRVMMMISQWVLNGWKRRKVMNLKALVIQKAEQRTRGHRRGKAAVFGQGEACGEVLRPQKDVFYVKFQWTWQDISLLKRFSLNQHNMSVIFWRHSFTSFTFFGDNAWHRWEQRPTPCCKTFSLSAHKALLDINDTAGRCRWWVDPPGFRGMVGPSHSHVIPWWDGWPYPITH